MLRNGKGGTPATVKEAKGVPELLIEHHYVVASRVTSLIEFRFSRSRPLPSEPVGPFSVKPLATQMRLVEFEEWVVTHPFSVFGLSLINKRLIGV